ncbi:hypothetical protein [Cryptosporangium sp. NPDC048952]|uniref:hypothetical protein n=1 Tax=Cryptosporangium sp. NPDC048952 TaxID=3363961 RepID=UPI00371FBFAA
MSIDLERASAFLASHGRVLDRHRLEAVVHGSDDSRRAVVAALGGYRNADGGYGWGLEPDLRARESQPGGAQHAFEALADAGLASPDVAGLLEWLDSVTLADGGLPFALPIGDPVGCAPFWVEADPSESSLQLTAAVAMHAHRAGRFDATILAHPWLGRASRYCFGAIRRTEEAPFAYVLAFALQFLDAASDTSPEALSLLDHLAQFVPADGALPVAGTDGETLHLLIYAPDPDRPVRKLLDPAAVSADLDRLEAGQRADGGWTVDYPSYSEAAALEWRGSATVNAVATLRRNGR